MAMVLILVAADAGAADGAVLKPATPVPAASPTSSPSPAPAASTPAAKTVTPAKPSSPTPAQVNLKDALVKVTGERNQYHEERDRLENRQWLLIAYSALISLLAGWLGLKYLAAGPRADDGTEPITDLFPSDAGSDITPTGATVRRGQNGTGTARRGNATITVRNADQQVEVRGKHETRRLFKNTDTVTAPSAQSSESGSAIVRKSDTRRVPNPVEPTAALQPREEPELKPQTDREIRAIPPKAETKSVFRKPPTEFLKNPRGTTADGTGSEPETKSVFRKPPTAAIPRTKRGDEGFTVIEVMISLAVLATVMAGIASSMYTLRLIQRANREQAQVEQLGRNAADLILGASWDWIGRETNDPTDDSHGAWSWHRRQSPTAVNQPLTETTTVPTDNLIAVHLLNAPTGITNLKVYVEYYRIDALTAAFSWSQNRGLDANPAAAWARARADIHNWYAEPPQLGLGQTSDDSLTVRIAITWDGVDAVGRSYELVFARRK